MIKTCLVCLESFEWIYREDLLAQVCEQCYQGVLDQWYDIRIRKELAVFGGFTPSVDAAIRRARCVFQIRKVLEQQ